MNFTIWFFLASGLFQWSDDAAHGATLRRHHRFHLIRQQPVLHERILSDGRHGGHHRRSAPLLSSDVFVVGGQCWVLVADGDRHLLGPTGTGEKWARRTHPELLHRDNEDLHHEPTRWWNQVQRAVRQAAVNSHRAANVGQQEFRNVLFTKIKESKTATIFGGGLGRFRPAASANSDHKHRKYCTRKVESSRQLLKFLLHLDVTFTSARGFYWYFYCFKEKTSARIFFKLTFDIFTQHKRKKNKWNSKFCRRSVVKNYFKKKRETKAKSAAAEREKKIIFFVLKKNREHNQKKKKKNEKVLSYFYLLLFMNSRRL